MPRVAASPGAAFFLATLLRVLSSVPRISRSFSIRPDAGDVVVVEARYTGTYKATGKPMNAQVCHVWTLEEGKVKKFQQYVDTAKMRDVMGAGA